MVEAYRQGIPAICHDCQTRAKARDFVFTSYAHR